MTDRWSPRLLIASSRAFPSSLQNKSILVTSSSPLRNISNAKWQTGQNSHVLMRSTKENANLIQRNVLAHICLGFILCDVKINDSSYSITLHVVPRCTCSWWKIQRSLKKGFFQVIFIGYIGHGGCNTVDVILMWSMSFVFWKGKQNLLKKTIR